MSDALNDNAGAGHTLGLLRVSQETDGEREVASLVTEALEDDDLFLIAETSVSYAKAHVNARRLAACWNALHDLTTEKIESLTDDDIANFLRNQAVESRRVGELEGLLAEALTEMTYIGCGSHIRGRIQAALSPAPARQEGR